MNIDDFMTSLEKMGVTNLRAVLDKTTELLNSERAIQQREKWDAVVQAVEDYCSDFGTIIFVDALDRCDIIDYGLDIDYCNLDAVGEIKWSD